jgi:RNA polymerase sigma-B factor
VTTDDDSPEPGLASSGGRIESLLIELAGLRNHDPRRLVLRRRVVESQLPLVHHLAQRFRGRGEPYDDLVQVGTIGLLNAVDRFDPERGAFTGFAVPTILGEIRRHFRDRGWAMRVPRRLQELGRRVSAAREELTHTMGRSPTVQELAAHLEEDLELVLEALDSASAYTMVPLPSVPEDTAHGRLGALDESLELVEDRATLRPLLAQLPARERTILALRFIRGMSQSQIAAEIGVSQMHVSRLLTRSLGALREGLSEEV